MVAVPLAPAAPAAWPTQPHGPVPPLPAQAPSYGAPTASRYDWPVSFEPAATAVGAERRMVPWAKGAIWARLAFAVLSAVAVVGETPYLRALWHYFRLAWRAGENHQPVPTAPSGPAGYGVLNDLASLGALSAFIILLVWQHRAASTARVLGIPSRLSPGWGVGFWFVPVVNFWFPYWAIVDCLPKGHPGRHRVLGYWLSFLFGGLLAAAGTITLVWSHPVGVALLAAGCALGVLAAALGLGVYDAIATAHASGSRAAAG